MEAIERIYDNDKLLSVIIRANYFNEGISFITPDNFPHQIGYMNRSKDYIILPHVHNKVIRKIEDTQETLIIKTGKVRIDYYDDNKNYLMSRVAFAGDIVLLAYGGHGFKMLEQSEIIEIKQGPYCGEKDKIRFESIDENKIIF